MRIKLIIIVIYVSLYSATNANQISDCLSAASLSITKWSNRHSEDKLGTMKFLKCLHFCLVKGKSSIDTMKDQFLNCFQTQTLMMNIWKEFLSRDDPVNCFEKLNGKILIGSIDHLFNGVENVEDCELKCQNYKEFECRSAAFYVKEKECVLSKETKDSASDLFVNDSNSIYLENLCVNKKKKSSSKPIKTTTLRPNESFKDESATMTKELQVPAEVIDSYGMPKQRDPEIHFQFKDQVLNERECFNEFYPPNIKTTTVERVQSLKECVSKCRECKNCLDNQEKCSIIGYSVEKQLCALAPKQKLKQIERSKSMGNFIFLRRGSCKHQN